MLTVTYFTILARLPIFTKCLQKYLTFQQVPNIYQNAYQICTKPYLPYIYKTIFVYITKQKRIYGKKYKITKPNQAKPTFFKYLQNRWKQPCTKTIPNVPK